MQYEGLACAEIPFEVCSPINHLSNYLGIFDVQFGTIYMLTKLLMLIPGSVGTATVDKTSLACITTFFELNSATKGCIFDHICTENLICHDFFVRLKII